MTDGENPLSKYTDPEELRVVVGGVPCKPGEITPQYAQSIVDSVVKNIPVVQEMWKQMAEAHKHRN